MNNQNEGATVWFTGLVCAGKTTLAKRIKEKLKERGKEVIILDSDPLRKTVSKNFGFTKEERDNHMKFLIEMCYLLNEQGALNITAVISGTRSIREEAKKRIKKFIEVYIKCPLEICKQRDVKGHYKAFEERKTEIIKELQFVGLNIPYEEPLNPDIIIETDKEDIDTCANKIISKMEEKKLI